MSGEFMQAQASPKDADEGREESGFIVGKVIGNCDKSQKGRVLVRIAARGGMEIWAKVVVPDTGVYFVPQVDDEVLVAFHQGDGNEAYVVGRLWNDKKLPPGEGKENPVTKRMIQTPKELEISFDDSEMSIVIKTKSGQHVTLKPGNIEIHIDNSNDNPKVKTNSAVINMDKQGNINITATESIRLNAPNIYVGNSETDLINIGTATTSRINIGG